MRRFTSVVSALIVVTLLLAFSGHTQSSAQSATPAPTAAGTPSADCNPSAVIKTLAALKTAGNVQKDLDALAAVDQSIRDLQATCNGLTFKGSGQKVIGPITLPSGTNLVHLVTPQYMIMTIKTLSGDCKAGGISPDTLYNVSAGDAKAGADTTIDSDNCKMLLLTENVGANPWLISFSLMQ